MNINEFSFYLFVFMVFVGLAYLILNFIRKRSLKRLIKNYDEKEDKSRERGNGDYDAGEGFRTSGFVEETKPIVTRLEESGGRTLLPTTTVDSVGKDSGTNKRTRKGFLRRRRRK